MNALLTVGSKKEVNDAYSAPVESRSAEEKKKKRKKKRKAERGKTILPLNDAAWLWLLSRNNCDSSKNTAALRLEDCFMRR